MTLEYKNMKPQKLPLDAISTRDAAKLLGLSMSHVRTLARKKILPAVAWGPTLAFSLAVVKAYGREKTDGRKKGTIRGALPGGFKPDVAPAS
jgi:excisionase family DNA binding protein